MSVALFDLDGTMADFETDFLNGMKALASPSEPSIDSYWSDDLPDHIKARKTLVKSQPGFWSGLPKLELGFQIFDVVVNEFGFEPVVLTKGPHYNDLAWAEKVEWCKKHLQDVPVTIVGGEDEKKGEMKGLGKGLVFGRILVDDYPPYVEAWLKFRKRGLVIMPANRWNVGFIHPNVLRFDGHNFAGLRERVHWAKCRKDGGDGN